MSLYTNKSVLQEEMTDNKPEKPRHIALLSVVEIYKLFNIRSLDYAQDDDRS